MFAVHSTLHKQGKHYKCQTAQTRQFALILMPQFSFNARMRQIKVCSHVISAKLLKWFRLNLTQFYTRSCPRNLFLCIFSSFHCGCWSVVGFPFPKRKKAAGGLQQQMSCPLEATLPHCNANAIWISPPHTHIRMPANSHRALKRAILGALNSQWHGTPLKLNWPDFLQTLHIKTHSFPSNHFSATWTRLSPWEWRQYVPPKRRSHQPLVGAKTQKTTNPFSFLFVLVQLLA